MKYLVAISLILIFIIFAYAADGAPYLNVKGILSLQSNFSDGKYSLEEIAELSRRKNVKIIIPSDDLLRRWEYGIKPLENLIKKRVEENSLLRIGIEKYLNRIKRLNGLFRDMVIVEAAAAAPFYWWDGSPWKRNLSLNDWHREMLVVGLENPQDYKGLPVVSNASLTPKNLKNISQIILPFLSILLGIFLIYKKITRKIIFKDTVFIIPLLLYKRLGYLFVSIGIIFLWNNWYFPASSFDQYHGDRGLKPYQEFIDYVNARGGLCFWLHPEGAEVGSVGHVATYTYKPASILRETYGYVGFPALQLVGEVNSAALAGNVWDEILLEYCRGRRKQPVWVVGELGFQDKEKIDSVQTIFLLKELSRRAVLNALKKGKMYAKLDYKENSLNLEDFSIQDGDSKNSGFMGDEVNCSAAPFINVKGNFPGPAKIKVDLIRNGKIIQSFEIDKSPFKIEFQDEFIEANKKIYYRLYIESSSGAKIITNPIFVTNIRD